jgi:hypothetical protein
MIQDDQDFSKPPMGIQAVTYVRVLPLQAGRGKGADISAEFNSVSVIEAGHSTSRHDGYVQVFDRHFSDQDVCEAIMGPEAGISAGAQLNPVAAAVMDAATVVMFVLGSRTTQKHQFLRRTYLPFLANELFATISDKRSNHTIGLYETSLRLGAFEIQDEVITDLVSPAKRGLVVGITTEDGVGVSGLQQGTYRDEAALVRALEDACTNRATHVLPPGASIDTASCVWEIELMQVEEVAGGAMRHSRSKVIVVDVASVDPLVMQSSDLRQFEGPTLHKSLATFTDVASRMASPVRAAIAPFYSSKLTHYLSELLGGNALVTALALVAPGEVAESRKTLELTSALAQSSHFPVSSIEFGELLRGLLSKYRAMILQAQDEYVRPRAAEETATREARAKEEGSVAAHMAEQRAAELQVELAEVKLDRNTVKEDYARLYEMMLLLKEKNKTLCEDKDKQATELIASEEEKLKLARALVEMKLELSAAQEKLEQGSFDSSAKLLQTKSEVFELDAQLQDTKAENQNLNTRLVAAAQAIKNEEEAATAARSALDEVRALYAKESDKNTELGAELLTLVNQKSELSSLLQIARAQADSLQVQLKTDADATDGMRNEHGQLTDRVRELREELLARDTKAAEDGLDIKRLEGELALFKTEADRTHSDFQRDRARMTEEARAAVSEEMQRAQTELDAMQGLLRRGEARQQQHEAQQQRLQDDVARLDGNDLRLGHIVIAAAYFALLFRCN